MGRMSIKVKRRTQRIRMIRMIRTRMIRMPRTINPNRKKTKARTMPRNRKHQVLKKMTIKAFRRVIIRLLSQPKRRKERKTFSSET